MWAAAVRAHLNPDCGCACQYWQMQVGANQPPTCCLSAMSSSVVSSGSTASRLSSGTSFRMLLCSAAPCTAASQHMYRSAHHMLATPLLLSLSDTGLAAALCLLAAIMTALQHPRDSLPTTTNPTDNKEQLTTKSLSTPSMVAAMAAELGRDPRKCAPAAAADIGLLLRARLEVCADRECSCSLSKSAPEL